MAIQIGQGAHDEDQEPLAEINTTPLIDVMLVLLIMLIVTIPVQTHAVKLDLPSTATPSDAQPAAVTVEVTSDGTILWNDQTVIDRSDLEARMRDIAGRPVQPELHLGADRLAPYDKVAAVLAAAERCGVMRLGILPLAE